MIQPGYPLSGFCRGSSAQFESSRVERRTKSCIQSKRHNRMRWIGPFPTWEGTITHQTEDLEVLSILIPPRICVGKTKHMFSRGCNHSLIRSHYDQYFLILKIGR